MKLTLILLPLVLLSHWSLAQERLSYNGHVRIKNLNYDIYEGRSDKRNVTQLRFRSEFQYKASEHLKAVFTPQATKYFGEVGVEPGGGTYLTSGDKYHSDLEFFEAYVKGKRGAFGYQLGRQTLSYGDKVVLGDRNWTASGQSFDAFKFTYDIGEGQLDLVHAKVTEGDDAARTEDDIAVSFLYYKVIRQEALELDTYFIFDDQSADDDQPDVRSLGIRYKQAFDAWDIYFEQIGQNIDGIESTEYSTNLEFGAKFGKARAFAYYSLNSAKYDMVYGNRHKYNGVLDIVGRKNLEAVSLGLTTPLSENLKMKAEVFQFSKQQSDEPSYVQSVSKTLNGNDEEKHLGNELDLRLFYTASESETIEAAASVFQHGDFFAEQKMSHLVYLKYLMKF